jgi:GT2 family glycosyltransferase
MAEHEFFVSLSNSGEPVHIPSDLRDSVAITKTSSNSFWAQSMEMASKLWQPSSRFTHVLWLNDDVELFPDSISNLLALMSSEGADVVVGQTASSKGLFSYGGFVRRSKLKPLHFNAVFAQGEPMHVDTFNGNIILLGPNALKAIGPFVCGYKHYLADIAYGLEATSQGLRVLVAPGFSGKCEPNLKKNPAIDTNTTRNQRIRALNTPPGLPIRQQWRYSIRYGRFLGLVYFLTTYLRFMWNLAFYHKGSPKVD